MRKALCLISILLLAGCGTGKESPAEDTKENIEFNRLSTEYNSKDLSITLDDYSVEKWEKFFTASLKVDEEAILIKRMPSLAEVSDTAGVHSLADSSIEDMKTKLGELSVFTDISVEDYNNAVQLACLNKDKSEQLTVNFRLDGICQILFYTRWDSNNDIQLESALDFVDDYLGISLSEADVYHLNNIIMEGAETGGKYTVYVNDKWSYNYFALSVSEFDTSAEKWEFYVSIAE